MEKSLGRAQPKPQAQTAQATEAPAAATATASPSQAQAPEPPIPEIHGNTLGLKSSHLKRLEATYRRKVHANEVASPELARHMTELARETKRQVGVLIDRRGEVTHVIVGDALKLDMPDVGRERAGPSRLRGVRLVHVHLKHESLTRDDLTDLALLRLDCVCAIEARDNGLPGKVHIGWLKSPDDKRVSSALEERLSSAMPSKPKGDDGGDGEADDVEPATAPTAKPKHKGGRIHEFKPKKDDGYLVKSWPDLNDVEFDPVAEAEETEAGFARVVTARKVAKDGTAILIAVMRDGKKKAESSMNELKELARTAGVEVVDTFIQARPQLDSRYVVGEGKLEELNLRAMQLMVDMMIFDHDLSPSQSRHLSAFTSLKILDRSQLILDIFAQRAKSADGKLQVELAQLKYMLPRLTLNDDGLSRLTGGIGGRGPGETKLEVDRRRVRDRITMLEQKIDDLSADRALRRAKRDRHSVPIVSIVGYTNAGKSTLLNALTNADVLAEDKLFATLDPTSRRLRFPHEQEVILTDTVGFIRALPKTLVNAFRATLEELQEADLLLHVIDVADPERDQQIQAVETILKSLNVLEKPRLLVFNQSDRLAPGEAGRIAHGRDGVSISALNRTGFAELLERSERILFKEGIVGAPGELPFEKSK